MKIKDTVKFLNKLQNEMNTQNNDGQMNPRFWVVGDYENRTTAEGFNDDYIISCPNQESYELVIDLYDAFKDCVNNFDVNEDVNWVLEFEDDEDQQEAQNEFDKIDLNNCCAYEEILAFAKKYYDNEAELIPVVRTHIIEPNTMFLTKRECEDHIKRNYYHYTTEAHTYAMTAWRSPQVEMLYDVLENTNWNKINFISRIISVLNKIKSNIIK